MAKKQNVVEKEFTLDLTNISKVANKKELPKKEKVAEKVAEKGIEKVIPKKQDVKEPQSRVAAKTNNTGGFRTKGRVQGQKAPASCGQ